MAAKVFGHVSFPAERIFATHSTYRILTPQCSIGERASPTANAFIIEFAALTFALQVRSYIPHQLEKVRLENLGNSLPTHIEIRDVNVCTWPYRPIAGHIDTIQNLQAPQPASGLYGSHL